MRILLCIMTDQTSGYFCIITMTENSMTRTENIFYFTVPPTDMSSCMLTHITVYKLLSLFLELNVCNVRIYINESVQRDVYKCCVAVWICSCLVNPRSSQHASHSGTVDVLLFTQFGIRRILDVSEFLIRCSWAALGAPSVFGFLKNMPTKMTL